MTRFKTEKCRGFFEHWASLRDEGQHVPSNSVFLDKAHPDYAPHLHIAEMHDGYMVFRLIGTKVVERWGRDKTGEVVGDGQPPDMQRVLYDNGVLSISTPCGFRMEMMFAASNGSEISIEALVLPLATEVGKPGRLVSLSEVVERLKYGDQSERYLNIANVDWVEIGAGVPEQDPWSSQA